MSISGPRPFKRREQADLRAELQLAEARRGRGRERGAAAAAGEAEREADRQVEPDAAAEVDGRAGGCDRVAEHPAAGAQHLRADGREQVGGEGLGAQGDPPHHRRDAEGRARVAGARPLRRVGGRGEEHRRLQLAADLEALAQEVTAAQADPDERQLAGDAAVGEEPQLTAAAAKRRDRGQHGLGRVDLDRRARDREREDDLHRPTAGPRASRRPDVLRTGGAERRDTRNEGPLSRRGGEVAHGERS
ncbi:hypothetical protein OV079_45500 [Nannocystis pusilla]|uniref:Uncharacterized protein n=1 Tax=Nannocystis pusilla TaxID=889268 RepID=A0A9X3J1G0_9BACT|nr:hypothetical protein [Nannocystis pusilla]MCY1012672.1 hypothetical protein [Nannocystis pusilla]